VALAAGLCSGIGKTGGEEKTGVRREEGDDTGKTGATGSGKFSSRRGVSGFLVTVAGAEGRLVVAEDREAEVTEPRIGKMECTGAVEAEAVVMVVEEVVTQPVPGTEETARVEARYKGSTAEDITEARQDADKEKKSGPPWSKDVLATTAAAWAWRASEAALRVLTAASDRDSESRYVAR